MGSSLDPLTAAVALFNAHRTPARVSAILGAGGSEQARTLAAELDSGHISAARLTASELVGQGVDVCFLGDPNFPGSLARLRRAPSILFTWGAVEILNHRAVGMCGSRNASERGIRAAQQCGSEVAEHGLAIVSGYARGVDTETHLAALRSNGETVIVLAEGIAHFRRKRSFSPSEFDANRIVAVSQFPPYQAWNVGAAMARNRVIVGLGSALVVIEAGETGGTLNAGMQAIKDRRPVLALEFSDGATPAGNKVLHEAGAFAVRSRQQLARVIERIGAAADSDELTGDQLRLL